MPMSERRVEYLPLDDVLAAADPQNPKDHDVDLIDRSVGRFGVIDVITRDDRTGRLISGHGRATTLGTQRDRGADPPDGVLVLEDGTWTVPVNVGWASKNDDEARAALIVLNRATEAGGWIDDALLSALDSLAGTEISLSDVGFNEDDLESYAYCFHLDLLLDAMINFLDDTGALTVAFAQGGDFIGGYSPLRGVGGEVAHRVRRKAMNTFLCRTGNPINFIGRLNEDVNTYVVRGSRGALFLTITAVSIDQANTQEQPGGNTEAYLNLGTYVKSFYSVMMAPSCVKVSTVGDVSHRMHHEVTWNRAVPKILSSAHRKSDE